MTEKGLGVRLQRGLGGGVRETEDEEGEKEDGDAENAAFGAYGSSGERVLPMAWVAKRRPCMRPPLSGTP